MRSALVNIQDRPTATNLLAQLLADRSEQLGFGQLLRLEMPEFRHQQEPDELTSHHVIKCRWPQRAGQYLAKLLPNPAAVARPSPAENESDLPHRTACGRV
ncbi:MAG: hypothetical protein IT428_27460 [Planctomycetaceae bacterium]|nr:hypothetical protein [Planctomycetaceae bacterium]